jgi:hypothetical protein
MVYLRFVCFLISPFLHFPDFALHTHLIFYKCAVLILPLYFDFTHALSANPFYI